MVEVVVVVIDAVFVKKNVRSKKNLVEKIHVQKTLGKNFFGRKELGPKKL